VALLPPATTVISSVLGECIKSNTFWKFQEFCVFFHSPNILIPLKIKKSVSLVSPVSTVSFQTGILGEWGEKQWTADSIRHTGESRASGFLRAGSVWNQISAARQSHNQTVPKAVGHIECRCGQTLYLRACRAQARKKLAKTTRNYGIAMQTPPLALRPVTFEPVGAFSEAGLHPAALDCGSRATAFANEPLISRPETDADEKGRQLRWPHSKAGSARNVPLLLLTGPRPVSW